MVPYLSVKETAKSIQWGDDNSFNLRANQDEKQYSKLTDTAQNVYGNYVKVTNLMYARVFGAGHMINERKAPQAKDLFYKWIFNPGVF